MVGQRCVCWGLDISSTAEAKLQFMREGNDSDRKCGQTETTVDVDTDALLQHTD